MADEKAREFWIKPDFNIDDGWDYNVPVCNRNIWDIPTIHVIEYSAYESLLLEAKKLERALEVISTNGEDRGMGWTAAQHARIALAEWAAFKKEIE